MNTLRKYLITFAVGSVIALLVLYIKDVFSMTEVAEILHALCDAFFVPGVLLVCSGLMVFSSNEGTFDMLVYGMDSFIDMFRKKSTKKYSTFYDYRESRKDKKLKFWYIVFTGLFFIALSMVMYMLYRRYI